MGEGVSIFFPENIYSILYSVRNYHYKIHLKNTKKWKTSQILKCWIVGLVCIPGESRGAINCSSWLCWRSRLEQRIGYMEQSIWFQGKSIPNTSWRKYWTGQYLNNSNQTLFPYFLLNSPSYTINVYVCVCVCVYIYTLYTHISAELSGSLDPSDQVVCRERHKEQNCIPLCLFCLKCTFSFKLFELKNKQIH